MNINCSFCFTLKNIVMLRLNHNASGFIQTFGVNDGEHLRFRKLFLQTVVSVLEENPNCLSWSKLSEAVMNAFYEKYDTSLEIVFLVGSMLGEFRFALSHDEQSTFAALFMELKSLENA